MNNESNLPPGLNEDFNESICPICKIEVSYCRHSTWTNEQIYYELELIMENLEL